MFRSGDFCADRWTKPIALPFAAHARTQGKYILCAWQGCTNHQILWQGKGLNWLHLESNDTGHGVCPCVKILANIRVSVYTIYTW